MHANPLIGLASVIVLGVGAQWIASRLRLPSILLLLVLGFLAGPVSGLVDPDALFGPTLFPLIAVSVALILFEGGLNLHLAELRYVGGVVLALVSVGMLATWTVATLAGHFVVGLSWPLALLEGALLTVTGPTVIGPLLRQMRPRRSVGAVLMWESILIDPIGALLALVVFEAIMAGVLHETPPRVVLGAVQAFSVGGAVGGAAAVAMVQLLKRHWVADHLQNGVSVMLVVAAFTLSNQLYSESGLAAVTVMGIVLANQRAADIEHIVKFKEHLQVLLLGGLFILLAARVQVESLARLGWPSLAFVLVLVLVARPLCVWVSSCRSSLTRAEKLVIAWMAPRGIVAAAVSSIFAIRLVEAGQPEAEAIVPLTFVVIASTVALYGLTAPPLAVRLGVAQQNPQGVLMLGAHALARGMAQCLGDEGIAVLLIDTNRDNVNEARMMGLNVVHGNALAEEDELSEVQLAGLGRFLALTSNDEANSLAAQRYAELFGRREVYQLAPGTKREYGRLGVAASPPYGRLLFGEGRTFAWLGRQLAAGAVIKKTKLSAEFTYKDFLAQYGPAAVPMFLLTPARTLRVFTKDQPPKAEPGQTLISLVEPVEAGSTTS